MESKAGIIINKELTNDTIIWRYTTLEKFLSLLVSSKLYLTSLKILNDKYEGELPSEFMFLGSYIPIGGKSPRYKRARELKETESAERKEILKKAQEDTFINCWAQDSEESYALWMIYSNIKSGIAIKSDIGSLKDSIRSDSRIHISKVRYHEVKKSTFEIENIVTRKRGYYKFENEIRLWTSSETETFLLPVELEILIKEIYLSPAMPPHIIEIIRATLNAFRPSLTNRICKSLIKFRQ